MPRPGPRKPNTAIRLSQETIDNLDAIIAKFGGTRSDHIREAVEEYVRGRLMPSERKTRDQASA